MSQLEEVFICVEASLFCDSFCFEFSTAERYGTVGIRRVVSLRVILFFIGSRRRISLYGLIRRFFMTSGLIISVGHVQFRLLL